MMHIDPGIVRALAIALVFLMLYGGRLTKGSVKQTPEGPAFGIKPLFALARGVVLPAYLLFFVYLLLSHKQPVPWWMALLFVAAVGLGLMQMPGTIVLTPTAITQRFWLRPSKSIRYTEVMSIHAMQGGRMTQVLGDNRVRITHTSNHSAAMEFQQEIERRTGKRLNA
jgi:hypothetical protein